MKDFCSCIENRVVYPISIKSNKSSYLTLYYYAERSDSILHNDAKNLLYFSSKAVNSRSPEAKALISVRLAELCCGDIRLIKAIQAFEGGAELDRYNI